MAAESRLGASSFAHCAAHCVHSARIELGLIVGLYLLYQAGRGLVGDAFTQAQLHAQDIAALERSLGFFWERTVQTAVDRVAGLPTLLGLSYVSLHVGATTLVLVWLYRRHSRSYAVARTTLILATAIALVVHILYPTAPPRLAELGVADTVATAARVDLGSDLLGPFYNPIAAVPSMHFGYALLVGFFVVARARHPLLRTLGALYPWFVLLVIVATGNHFLLDAVAGAVVIVAAGALARLATRNRTLARPDEAKSSGVRLGLSPDASSRLSSQTRGNVDKEAS